MNSLGEEILAGLAGDSKDMALALFPAYIKLLDCKRLLAGAEPGTIEYEILLGDFNVQAVICKQEWAIRFGDTAADVANAVVKFLLGMLIA